MGEESNVGSGVFTADVRDGVLWIQWRWGTSVSDTDAAALVRRADALCESVCPPMLVILNGMVSLSRGALSAFAHALNISAMAIVGPSAVDRTLAGYFTDVHCPPYPTRYYDNAAQALIWLTEHPHGQ